MIIDLKTAVRQNSWWQDLGGPVRDRRIMKRWLAAGRPTPVPHPVKVRNIMTLADIFNVEILVETGTFRGMMIDACLQRFSEIHSVEIYQPLANAAKRRFAPFPHVHIHEGDSGEVLATILPGLKGRALFWLDGHYSGEGTGIAIEESPVVREIASIRECRSEINDDIIIIDDARCFNGTAGYPAIADFVAQLAFDFNVTPNIADDAIMLLPAR